MAPMRMTTMNDEHRTALDHIKAISDCINRMDAPDALKARALYALGDFTFILGAVEAEARITRQARLN